MNLVENWKSIKNKNKQPSSPEVKEKTVEERLAEVEKKVDKIVEVVEIPTEGG